MAWFAFGGPMSDMASAGAAAHEHGGGTRMDRLPVRQARSTTPRSANVGWVAVRALDGLASVFESEAIWGACVGVRHRPGGALGRDGDDRGRVTGRPVALRAPWPGAIGVASKARLGLGAAPERVWLVPCP